MGVFISLEGLDGSGKSTMAERLVRAFRTAGLDALLTREPGGTTLGEHVRSILLRDESTTIVPRAETLLFAAARAQLVDEVIRPALERGAVIVTDRFTDSSLAYQWGGRGVDKHGVGAVQLMATAGLEPDIKILLDLPVETALGRRLSHGGHVNRLDKEAVEFHARVRNAYHRLAEADPGRWRVVDASRSEDQVWADVSRLVDLDGLAAAGAQLLREEPN